jgi:DNA-binding MarR family transcriptional regulator
MTQLRAEIRQKKAFVSVEQESFLSVGRTWALLDHAFSEALKPYGVTLTQYNVLRILRGAGDEGLCRAEVMQRMIAQVPDATRLLDRMEAAGFISRARDGKDRRFVTTRISRQGRQLLAGMDAPVNALHRKHFATLSGADQRTLIELLDRVRDGI